MSLFASAKLKILFLPLDISTWASQYAWYQKLASTIKCKCEVLADFCEWLDDKRFGGFIFGCVLAMLIFQIVALTYWGPIERFYAVYNFDVTPPLFLEVMVSVILVYLESKIILPGTVFVLEYLDND